MPLTPDNPEKHAGTPEPPAKKADSAGMPPAKTSPGGKGKAVLTGLTALARAWKENPLRSPAVRTEEENYVSEVDAALARTPKNGARMLSLATGCLLACLFLWSSVAEIDEVTHAEGQIVPSQRTQAIQNLEGGILREVLVHEGQTVEKNTLLAQLDNEAAESNYRDALTRAIEHRIAIIRLNAERDGTEPVFTDDLLQYPKIIAAQMAVHHTRYQQQHAEMEMLQSQYDQRVQEVDEQIARKKQLSQSLALSIEQRNIARPLMERKIYSRVDYLKLEQEVVRLEGDIEALASSLPKTQAAAQEAQQRISFRKAEIDAATADEISKHATELNSLKEVLAAGGDRVTRTELRSPVRGIVKQIYIHTSGGVVKPGESIMDIVPLDDTLLVEARVRPADVAFLHPGQKAMVKVSAYDFSIYGGLEGSLEQISADTIEDKRGDFYYLVKLRTQKTSIVHHNEHLPIIPGMIVTVDILTGKKTVLDYVLKPILKAKQNALTER